MMSIKKKTILFLMLFLVSFPKIEAMGRGSDDGIESTKFVVGVTVVTAIAIKFYSMQKSYLCQEIENLFNEKADVHKIYNWEIVRYKYSYCMHEDKYTEMAVIKQLMQDYNSMFISRSYRFKTGKNISEVIMYGIEELEYYQKKLKLDFKPRADLIKICEEYNLDKSPFGKIRDNPIHWTDEQQNFIIKKLEESSSEYINFIGYMFSYNKRMYSLHCLLDRRIERLKFLLALIGESPAPIYRILIENNDKKQ